MSEILDHRQLADEMQIFASDQQVGAGLPLWLPNGMAIREQLEQFMKEREFLAGYERVASPHVARAELYERSGHLQCFRQDMFPPMQWPDSADAYYLRPMNCPHHHQIFAALPRSYRQLPLRLAEYGQVYRYEPSGSLRGLNRVRGLCQNDAHIYIEKPQSQAEVGRVLDLHEACYRALRLKGYRYRLSLGDRARPDDFFGSPENWQEAEAILRRSLIARGVPFFEAQGEAAFYGPKIDVQMPMVAGGEESIASLQLDFVSGERFALEYIDRNGARMVPWIIHRAPLGSHERFVALLLEFYQGQLPAWLAPIQVYILPVSPAQVEFAQALVAELMRSGLRAKLDLGQGSLSKRILFARRLRPYARVVVGACELESKELKIELRDGELAANARDLSRVLSELCAQPCA